MYCLTNICTKLKWKKEIKKIKCVSLLKYLRFATQNANELISNNRLELHPDCKKCLSNGIKPRKHSGIIRTPRIQLPSNVEYSIEIVIEKYPFNNLRNQAEELFDYLWSRKLPIEENDIRQKMNKLTCDIVERETLDIESLPEKEYFTVNEKVKNKVISRMKSNTYNWKPLKYDAFQSMQYLFSRSSFDYAATYRVFYEVVSRSKLFKPQTILHFGSGVGSSVWAANELWGSQIKEHMCVDQSPDMNTLARLVLQGGSESSNAGIPGVYFRQFFSPSPKVKYDIVIAAFTLFEIPNRALRLQIIEHLWAKSNDYLIIIENGTNSGFQIINEAREKILNIDSNMDKTGAHIFAPCPHDLLCPRYERNDGTPCNFVNSYLLPKKFKSKELISKFSYIVFKKGARNIGEIPWRRIVRPVKEVSKRAFLRTCTPEGTIEYSVITAKQNSKELYECAKACSWGDLLPAVTAHKSIKTATNQNLTELKQTTISE